MLLSLLASVSWAIGMGEIQPRSHLGQPLDARIALYDTGDFSVEQLKAAMASAEEHQRFGVEPVYQLRNIRLQVVMQNGQSYLQLSSREPIVEPYLDFVLSLRWSGGALLKNFTVLLDPVILEPVAVAQQTAEKSSAVAAVQAVSPEKQAPQPVRAVSSSAAPSVLSTAGDYVTRSGDSLWRIAKRYKPAGISQQQMMNLIHQQNLHAFVAGDANRIKAMVTIRLPSPEALAAVTAEPAVTATPSASQSQQSTPQSSAQQESQQAVQSVAADPVAPADSSTAVLAKQDAAVESPLSAAERVQYQQEIAELSGRVETLTAELGGTQQKMASLQSQMQALIEQYQQISARDQQVQRELANQRTRPDQAINTLSASDISQPVVAHTPWWVHGGYLLAIFALGCWLIWDHRKMLERRWHTAEALVPVSESGQMGTAISSSAAAMPRSAAAPDWNNLRSRDELPAVGEEQRDPLLAASAYAAFGRYQEAEQILSQAIAETPQRSELYLELLQVYLRNGDMIRLAALREQIAVQFAGDADVLRELQRLS